MLQSCSRAVWTQSPGNNRFKSSKMHEIKLLKSHMYAEFTHKPQATVAHKGQSVADSYQTSKDIISLSPFFHPFILLVHCPHIGGVNTDQMHAGSRAASPKATTGQSFRYLSQSGPNVFISLRKGQN